MMIARFNPYDSLPQVQIQTNESENIEKILPPKVNDEHIFDTFPSSMKDIKIDIDPSTKNFISHEPESELYGHKIEYEMMNRNARRPKKANHGKRPNCNVMRKLKRHNRKIKLTR